MIFTAWAIFRNSLPLQLVMLALAGWAALAGNNFMQRQKGAAAAITVIEKKADANAEIATEVRTHVDSGKRGKPDPHLRPSRLQ
jgi:GTPase